MRHGLSIAITAALMVTACGTAQAAPTSKGRSISTGTAGRYSLSQLSVSTAGAPIAYKRTAFGDGWGKVGNCDARNVVLKRDLRSAKLRAGSSCIVESGTLVDSYTGETIAFKRGWGSSGAVQIDHIVPVANAWKSGAWRWSSAQRRAFYSDTSNLKAVSGAVNQAKGAKDASQYLPKVNRCLYAQAVIDVKGKYKLTVTPAEKVALGGACK